MLSSFASLQHPQSALHSSTSSNPFLPRPPPDNDIAQPVGFSQWTNRCGHVHRRSGCKKGNACTYCHVHPITKAEDRNRPSKTDRGYGATRDLAMDLAMDPSFQERPVQHRPPPKNCTPATAIRSDAIDFLLERMRKVDPRKMEKLAFDMFVLDNNYLPGIAFLSSPLAGQSSGRDPEAPVATGNWGRASGHKNTWIPCPPRDWSELKSMTMEDVQQAAVQRRNSKKRRFK